MRTWSACEAYSWGLYGDEKKLAAALRGKADYHSHHRPPSVVKRELRDAIAKGSVEARGFKVNHRPSVSREVLPQDVFQQFQNLAVDECGETTFMHPASPQDIPRWRAVVFPEDEIRALWPKPMPDLDKWMEASVITDPDKKRDHRILDCRKATGCTHREVAAAFSRLPPDMKRRRGNKIRQATTVK